MATADDAPDLRLINGKWEKADILAECPESGNIEEFLKAQGWEEFLSIGDPEGHLGIESWRRRAEGKPPEYMLQVSDVNCLSPMLVVDSFTELMDLISRWAPAVQAAAIAGVMQELWHSGYSGLGSGLVETVAARAAYGTDEGLAQLRSQAEGARRQRAAAIRRRKEEGQGQR